MNGLRRILMVEDDARDVELSLTALEQYNLANEVVVVGDGEEALDYLYQRGKFMARREREPRRPAAGSQAAQGRRARGAAADQDGRPIEDDPRGGAHLLARGARHGGELSARCECVRRQTG